MTEFVTAINAKNRKQRIPRAWLDHPVLGKGFRLSASSRTVRQDSPAEKPVEKPGKKD